MNNKITEWMPNLTRDVVEDALGWKLCAYLIALEGWRRGLTLKWYYAESEKINLKTIGSSSHGKFFSLSSGENIHFFFRSRGDGVSNDVVKICEDKNKTKGILSKSNIPVPKGKVFRANITSDEDIIKYAKEIHFPIVIKPTNGSLGKGVYSDIQNEVELKNALKNLRQMRYSNYIVEKHHPGNEYRVYVVGEKVIAVANRIPANITGDGRSSVKRLIEIKNIERSKNPYLSRKLIKIDSEVLHRLKGMDYNEKSVPNDGEQIFLREKSNLAAGGDPLDATDELSEEVKNIAVNALKAIPGLPHAGVDIIVDPDSDKKGTVIEINATAEIGFHLFPLVGKARDIPAAIIDYYYPETIEKKKTNLYFDFKSVLEPLRTRSVNEIEIAHPSLEQLYGRKYIVSGEVKRKGYMNWIRTKALKGKMNGYAQMHENGKIEVVVVSTNKKDVNEFREACSQGSNQSKVKHVEVQDWNLDEPLKLGFEINLKPKGLLKEKDLKVKDDDKSKLQKKYEPTKENSARKKKEPNRNIRSKIKQLLKNDR